MTVMRKVWIASFAAVALTLGLAWFGTIRIDATPYGDGGRIMPFIHLINGMNNFSFWDPYRNGGYPILGNAEHFFFLSWLIDPDSKNANLLLNIALYLHLLFIGFVGWLVARKEELSPFWAAIAAITIGFSEPIIVLKLAGRFQGLAMFLVLLFVHLVMQSGYTKKNKFLFLSILSAMALITSGYYALFVPLIILSYELFDSRNIREITLSHAFNALLYTALIGGAGLLLSAPFTFPLIYHTQKSFVIATKLSYSPDVVKNIANIIIPACSEDRIYVSSLIAIAFFLLFNKRSFFLYKALIRHVLPIGALLLFSLLYLPLIGEYLSDIYSKLPIISGIRRHNAYIFAAIPSLVLVSCKILQEYQNYSISKLSFRVRVFLSIFFFSYMFFVGYAFLKGRDPQHFYLGVTVVILMFLFGGITAIPNRYLNKIRKILTIKHVAISLVLIGVILLLPEVFTKRNIWNQRPVYVKNKSAYPAITKEIKKDDTPFFRVYRGSGPLFGILQAYERTDGFSYLFPKGWAYSLYLLSPTNELNPIPQRLNPIRPHWVKKTPCAQLDKDAIDLLGIKYLIIHENKMTESLPGWQKVIKDRRRFLLKRKDFSNPIRVFYKWRISEILPPKDARSDILSSFKKSEVLIDKLPDGFKNYKNVTMTKSNETKVELMQVEPGIFELLVNSRAKSILVIPENWDEGWNLFINGKKKETVRAFMGYIGVPLQSGVSRIMLKYKDYSFLIGLLVSGFTLFVLTGLCILPSNRKEVNSLSRVDKDSEDEKHS